MQRERHIGERKLDRGTVAWSGFFGLIALSLITSPRSIVDIGFGVAGLIWAKALWDSRYQTPGNIRP